MHLAGRVGLPIPEGGSKGAWSIALSGGALSHMPVDEQLQYSNAFGNYENWDMIRRDERDAWVRLDVLDQAAPLASGDWVAVRQALSQALASDARIAAVGPFIFEKANVGRRPKPETLSDLFHGQGYGGEICNPILAPAAESD